ncbi:hypothetical protein [Streptomyces noursei]|uniref:hypothetical protein n=1 Tax=Streptomyces noursei TaxID=1971 RepID=UPI0005C9C3F4
MTASSPPTEFPKANYTSAGMSPGQRPGLMHAGPAPARRPGPTFAPGAHRPQLELGAVLAAARITDSERDDEERTARSPEQLLVKTAALVVREEAGPC